MQKMFKRSALGAAVAVAAMSAATVQAKPATETVDLYGQIAVSVWGGENNSDTLDVANESRFGLRGSADLERGPKLFWQMEGGNVGDDGSNSGLGVRDTFIGFEFDAGKVRVGRMLTPAYQIVDWPFSGQSRGKVFDWGGDVEGGTNYDRKSDMVRFDSAQFGGAVNFSLAAGKGNITEEGNNFYGASMNVKAGPAVFHVGYEAGQDREVTAAVEAVKGDLDNGVLPVKAVERVGSDTSLLIAGVEASFGNFGIHGAYKVMSASYDKSGKGDQDQTAFSVGASYSVNDWLFRAGYAANQDLQEAGKADKTAVNESIISAEALYFLDPAALIYVRPYQITTDTQSQLGYGVGVEYYF